MSCARQPGLSQRACARVRARFVISRQLSREHCDADQPRCLLRMQAMFVRGEGGGGTCEALQNGRRPLTHTHSHVTCLTRRSASVGMCHPTLRSEQERCEDTESPARPTGSADVRRAVRRKRTALSLKHV